eukprot:461523-Pelagomonas_calceolata.AAC.2
MQSARESQQVQGCPHVKSTQLYQQLQEIQFSSIEWHLHVKLTFNVPAALRDVVGLISKGCCPLHYFWCKRVPPLFK